MKTTQFLIYKERFISYLRDFIKGLQANSTSIKYFFEELDDNIVENIIFKILEYAKNLPRVGESFDEEISENTVMEGFIA